MRDPLRGKGFYEVIFKTPKYKYNVFRKKSTQFFFSVSPTRIELKRVAPFFNAEKSYNISCSTFGSNPQPYTRIWHQNQELPVIETKAISNLESKITAKFLPVSEDDGTFLICKSENPLITNSAVEDQWKITVKCTVA